jgi:hypothetical protein
MELQLFQEQVSVLQALEQVYQLQIQVQVGDMIILSALMETMCIL